MKCHISCLYSHLPCRHHCPTNMIDMEYELRSHCKKLKVSAKNLSGAHLMLTGESIAIRAYYPYDLGQISAPTNQQSTGDDDFDGLSKFLKSFKKALVMFILHPNDPVFQQQLDDSHSYFHRAQRIVGQHTMEYPVRYCTGCVPYLPLQ